LTEDELPTIQAKSMKVTVPIKDGDFPTTLIPPKGSPGSGSAKLTFEIDADATSRFVGQVGVKTLQRAKEAADTQPGGHWVLSGKLGPGNEILEAGVIYSPPAQKKEAASGA
jgi:hypothetical protein